MSTDSRAGESTEVNRHEVVALCTAALQGAGADRRVAALLTESALFAEDRGRPLLGVAHLLEHVDALRDGRLDGTATPRLNRPTPVLTVSDARGGIAQAGFDDGFAGLVRAARRSGLAAFTQRGAYTCGPLGWFTERLAGAGLLALATAVSPAALATGPGTGRVLGTNPLAWSLPCPGRAPVTADQSSGGASFVALRDAAARGVPIPEGWALDAAGRPTTDAAAALEGALLPFGGHRGANVALLAEMLSSMAGGSWSLDAPAWDSGSRSPSVGMFVLALDPAAADRGFPARVRDQLRRLAGLGVHLPGGRGGVPRQAGRLELRADVVATLRESAAGALVGR